MCDLDGVTDWQSHAPFTCIYRRSSCLSRDLIACASRGYCLLRALSLLLFVTPVKSKTLVLRDVHTRSCSCPTRPSEGCKMMGSDSSQSRPLSRCAGKGGRSFVKICEYECRAIAKKGKRLQRSAGRHGRSPVNICYQERGGYTFQKERDLRPFFDF